jgi:penicillin amidase
MRANSVAELDEAMRNWVDPCNNLTMADVHGTIAYLHRGRVPVRPIANGWLPVPGWTSEYEWQGDIPFEELPRVNNPDTGWIGTANNRITGDDYPHYLSHDYAPPYRAMRLVERLSALKDATIDDMASIHADRVSIPSRWFVEALVDAKVDDEVAEQARQRLLAWDGVMDKDLVPPALYAVARDQLVRRIVSSVPLSALNHNPYVGEPGPMSPAARLWSNAMTMLRAGDTSVLPEGETWPQLLATALTSATAILRKELGDNMDEWQWRRLHTTQPIHPLAGTFPELADSLNPPAVSIGGDADTVQAAGAFPGQSFYVNGTSVSRYAFDLGNWDNSRWVSPLGASGHPGSKHYGDQAIDWSEVRMNPMLYAWDQVEADAETKQRLEPEQA